VESAGQAGGAGEDGVLAGHQLQGAGQAEPDEQPADWVPRPPGRDHQSEGAVHLERENRELRRANEILKSAAAFFGAELDRRPPR
jgi:transposase-like protein